MKQQHAGASFLTVGTTTTTLHNTSNSDSHGHHYWSSTVTVGAVGAMVAVSMDVVVALMNRKDVTNTRRLPILLYLFENI